MKAFLQRNTKELLTGVIPCTAGAIVSLWLGAVAPDFGSAVWYAGCYVVFAATAGYWVWAIGDNAEQDRLEQEVSDQFNRTVDERVEDGRWTPELAEQMREIRRVLNGEVSQ